MDKPNPIIEEAWSRATKVSGYDGDTWRTDAFGSAMLRSDYRNRESRYGWVLARIRTKDPARPDSAEDFRAVQWQNV